MEPIKGLGPVVSESDPIPQYFEDEKLFGEVTRTAEEAEEYVREQEAAMKADRAENEFFLKCLKMAHNYGLQHEFLDGFFHYLRGGDSITMAANCAMYDWDM